MKLVAVVGGREATATIRGNGVFALLVRAAGRGEADGGRGQKESKAAAALPAAVYC